MRIKVWFIAGAMLIFILFFGARLDVRKSLERFVPGAWSMPVNAEIGSCYAYEYGYDVPVKMDYIPYRDNRPFNIAAAHEAKLWLAVRNRESAESLEEGSLHVTFPESVEIRSAKSWVCLGTGTNGCYIDFNRSLHPQGSICLEPLLVTLTKPDLMHVEYSVTAKNRRAQGGVLDLIVNEPANTPTRELANTITHGPN